MLVAVVATIVVVCAVVAKIKMKVVMASVDPFQFFSSGKLTKKLAEHKISKDFLHFSIIQRMKLVKRIHH